MDTEQLLYLLDNESPIQFIQITDTHLVEAVDGQLRGLNTQNSLEHVLSSIQSENDYFDFFVVSGDLSQDGSPSSYQRLQESLAPFNVPSFWFPGNHDEMSSMKLVCQDKEHLENIVRTPHWQLVLLNSQVEGAAFGNLADDQFELLERALTERPDLHTLISLHHHPIPMESGWMDEIGLKNGEKLMEVARKYSKVKCILWGHVHQDSDRMVDGIRMLSTPSTCVQFTPKSIDFNIDTIAPGYRRLQLNHDGSIETEMSRVKGIEVEVDLSVKRY
ncbi:MAG: Icc protein [Oleiphilaceae bacterium]